MLARTGSTFGIVMLLIISNLLGTHKPRIGLLVLDTPITSSWSVISPLIELCTDPTIEALIIIIDFQAVSQYPHAQALMRDIITLKKRYSKPVTVYSETDLTGAGYLVACAADTIITSPVTMLGSLGTTWNSHHIDKKNRLEGKHFHLLYSGSYKYMGDPNMPAHPEHLLFKQDQVNKILASLCNDITTARPSLTAYTQAWNTGELFIAAHCKNIPFVDKTGDKFDVIAHVLQQLAYDPTLPLEAVDIVTKVPRSPKNYEYSPSSAKKFAIGIARITTLDVPSWHYTPQLIALLQDPYINALVLSVDSRGGISALGNTLHSELVKLRAIYAKPIITYVDNLALSAGYHVSCAGQTIIAAPGAAIGSIGSRSERWDTSQQEIRQHITYNTCVSGRFMNAHNPHTPLAAADKEMLTAAVKGSHMQFIEHVLQSRPHLQATRNLWAEAQVYRADQALALGLIDAIGSPLTVMSYLAGQDYALQDIDLIVKDIPVVSGRLKSDKKRYRKKYISE
jgi:signal peptide peptidase SppA